MEPPPALCRFARGALGANRYFYTCDRRCCRDPAALAANPALAGSPGSGPDGCDPAALALDTPKCPNRGACPDYCATAVPTDCAATKVLTRNAMRSQATIRPAFSAVGREVRRKTIATLAGANAAELGPLQEKYPGAPLADVAFHDLTRCLSDEPSPSGKVGYIGRAELAGVLGYRPRPAFGVDGSGAPLLAGVFPAKVTDLVPVSVDRFVGPDLAVVLFVLFLALVAVALVVSVRRTQAKKARQQGVVATWKGMVPLYEAEGRDMGAYRRAFGMPAKK